MNIKPLNIGINSTLKTNEQQYIPALHTKMSDTVSFKGVTQKEEPLIIEDSFVKTNPQTQKLGNTTAGSENLQQNSEQKLITEEDVIAKLETVNIPDFIKERILENTKTQEQIDIANKILSNCSKIYEKADENMSKMAWLIVGDENEDLEQAQKQAQLRFDLLDIYFSDERLYKNEFLKEHIAPLISCCSENEEYSNILTEFLSDPELYENELLQDNFWNIISFSNADEGTVGEIAHKVFSEPGLRENESLMKGLDDLECEYDVDYLPNFLDELIARPYLLYHDAVQDNLGTIVYNASSEKLHVEKLSLVDSYIQEQGEEASYSLISGLMQLWTEDQLDFAKTVLSDSKLYANESLQREIEDIICFSFEAADNTEAIFDFIDKYLSDPRLYKNESLQKELGPIIYSLYNSENAEAKFDVIEKYLSDPRLYENESLQGSIARIVSYTDDSESAELKFDVIEKYLSDPKLYENEKLQAVIADVIRKSATIEEATKMMDDIVNS